MNDKTIKEVYPPLREVLEAAAAGFDDHQSLRNQYVGVPTSLDSNVAALAKIVCNTIAEPWRRCWPSQVSLCESFDGLRLLRDQLTATTENVGQLLLRTARRQWDKQYVVEAVCRIQPINEERRSELESMTKRQLLDVLKEIVEG